MEEKSSGAIEHKNAISGPGIPCSCRRLITVLGERHYVAVYFYILPQIYSIFYGHGKDPGLAGP